MYISIKTKRLLEIIGSAICTIASTILILGAILALINVDKVLLEISDKLTIDRNSFIITVVAIIAINGICILGGIATIVKRPLVTYDKYKVNYTFIIATIISGLILGIAIALTLGQLLLSLPHICGSAILIAALIFKPKLEGKSDVF